MEPIDFLPITTAEEVLAALLREPIDVVYGDDAAEQAVIVGSQAITDAFLVIPGTQQPVPVPTPVPRLSTPPPTPPPLILAEATDVDDGPAVLAADSQPFVVLSPCDLAVAADAATCAGDGEPRTPANRVSTVVLPPADPIPTGGGSSGWLNKASGGRIRGLDGGAGGCSSDGDSTDFRSVGGRGRAPARAPAHLRRRLFQDVARASSTAANQPSDIEDSDIEQEQERQPDGSPRDPARGRRARPVGRPALTAAERVTRVKQQKLKWANNKKKQDQRRRHVINWLLAKYPGIVSEYEASAMNVDGIRVKDLL